MSVIFNLDSTLSFHDQTGHIVRVGDTVNDIPVNKYERQARRGKVMEIRIDNEVFVLFEDSRTVGLVPQYRLYKARDV